MTDKSDIPNSGGSDSSKKNVYYPFLRSSLSFSDKKLSPSFMVYEPAYLQDCLVCEPLPESDSAQFFQKPSSFPPQKFSPVTYFEESI